MARAVYTCHTWTVAAAENGIRTTASKGEYTYPKPLDISLKL